MSVADKILILSSALYADANINEYIAMAETLISRTYFGALADQAVALMACHIYTLSKRVLGAAGPIASMTEKSLSISYASSGATDDDLSQTHYGKQLKSLRRMVGPAATVNEGVFTE